MLCSVDHSFNNIIIYSRSVNCMVGRWVGLCCWGCSAVRRECAWHSKKESQRETPTPKYVDYIQSRFPFKADASGGHCYCWQILRPVATIILIILGERAFWIPWRLQQANGDEFLKPDSQTDDPQGTMGEESWRNPICSWNSSEKPKVTCPKVGLLKFKTKLINLRLLCQIITSSPSLSLSLCV